MKILVLNPPYLKNFSRPQRSPAVTKSGTLYFPMWLAYAVAALENAGHEVDFIDAPADGHDLNYVTERTKKLDPALIVSDTSTPSIYNDVSVAVRLKETCTSAFVVLVGTHVSALPEETLKIDSGIDAVAVHEYENTLLELADTLTGDESLEKIAGISYQDNGKVTHNPLRPYMEDLDELPFVSKVYKKFLNIENYFNPNALFPMVTITTSRGCPFKCTFCVYPQTLMGRGYRLRSIKNVVDEIEYIVNNFPEAKAIFFEDDTLTVNKKRCIEMSEELIRRGIKISWTANARVGLDLETMKKMKSAGCRSFCVGFESGNQDILDNMRKSSKIDLMFDFMNNAKKAGILVHGCFLAGLPGETKDTMRQTLELAKRLQPDTVQFYPVMVYPGTEAYDWYKDKGLLITDDFSKWITPGGLHNTVVKTENLSPEDLVKFCDDARRDFYLRPSYLAYKVKQMMMHPEEIKRTLKSGKTFVKYLLKGSDIS